MNFARKLTGLIPTYLAITVLAFGLIRLVPGDPVMLMLGERGANPEVYQEMQAALGLDRPILEQYFVYVGKALQGDLGRSVITNQPVLKEFLDRFPATFELALMAMLIAACVGIPIGILAAYKRGTFFDFSLMTTSLVGYSMPIFWWGLILILFFSVGLGLTPVSGRISVMYDIPHVTGLHLIDTLLSDEGFPAFFDSIRHLLLPAFAMGTIPMAAFARMTRSSMLEVMGEDYIKTAKAKGLATKVILLKHAFRNALIPIITVGGLMFGSLITGAILTETIFSWPGIGKWILASVTARDYPVIQGGILLIATMVMAINLLVDLSYAVVNPRLRSK